MQYKHVAGSHRGALYSLQRVNTCPLTHQHHIQCRPTCKKRSEKVIWQHPCRPFLPIESGHVSAVEDVPPQFSQHCEKESSSSGCHLLNYRRHIISFLVTATCPVQGSDKTGPYVFLLSNKTPLSSF
jgi:hypothetical protein